MYVQYVLQCVHVHSTVYLNLNFYIFEIKKEKLIKKGKLTISEYMYMYFILTHPILHVAKRAIASVGNVVGIFGRGTLETPFSPTTIFFFLSVFFFPNKYVPKIAFFQRQKFAYNYYLYNQYYRICLNYFCSLKVSYCTAADVFGT